MRKEGTPNGTLTSSKGGVVGSPPPRTTESPCVGVTGDGSGVMSDVLPVAAARSSDAVSAAAFSVLAAEGVDAFLAATAAAPTAAAPAPAAATPAAGTPEVEVVAAGVVVSLGAADADVPVAPVAGRLAPGGAVLGGGTSSNSSDDMQPSATKRPANPPRFRRFFWTGFVLRVVVPVPAPFSSDARLLLACLGSAAAGAAAPADVDAEGAWAAAFEDAGAALAAAALGAGAGASALA